MERKNRKLESTGASVLYRNVQGGPSSRVDWERVWFEWSAQLFFGCEKKVLGMEIGV